MSEVKSVNVGTNSMVILNTSSGAISIPELAKLNMSSSASTWHSYEQPVVTLIGTTKEITIDNVFKALKHYPSPSYAQKEIQNNGISNVTGLGNVEHLVYNNERIVINATQPNHLLYPGIVVRNVYEDNGNIYIKTYGVGNGDFAALNEAAADLVWSYPDGNIRVLSNIYGKRIIPEILPSTLGDFNESITNDIRGMSNFTSTGDLSDFNNIMQSFKSFEAGGYVNYNGITRLWFNADYADPSKRDIYAQVDTPAEIMQAVKDGKLGINDLSASVVQITYNVGKEKKEYTSAYIFSKKHLESLSNRSFALRKSDS